MPPETVITGNTDLPAPAQAGAQTSPDTGSSLPAGFVPYTATPQTPGPSAPASAGGLPPGFVPFKPPAPAASTPAQEATAAPAQQGFTDAGDGTIDTDDDSNPVKQAGEQLASVGAGMGKGLLDSLSGAAGALSDIDPSMVDFKARVDQGRAELDKDNRNNPKLNAIGYGGETLAEFMMGDEALKGLSFADRLDAVAKTAKILQKSPRLLQALKIGASAGTIQGTQTGIRTDGSFLDRAKAGAKSGAVAAGTGAVVGAAGNWLGDKVSGLGKGLGDTADTMEGMWDTNRKAKAASDLAQDLTNDLKAEKSRIDTNFDTAKQSAESSYDTANQAATAQRQQTLRDALDARDSETTDAYGNKQENADTVRNTLAEQKAMAEQRLHTGKQAVQDALTQTRKDVQQKFVDTLARKAGNPADPSELAEVVNSGLDSAEQAAHDMYEEGINGDKGVLAKLEGQKVPVIGSPYQAAAIKVLKEPTPTDHEMTKDAAKMAGNNLRADVRKFIEDLKKGSKTAEPDPTAPKPKLAKGAPKPIPEEIPLKDMTAKDLIAQRQYLRATSTEPEFMRGDINRREIAKMIDGIDDTLQKMAKANGESDVMDQYSQLRADYKAARANLDSPAADKLNLKNASPDKALGDVNKYLLGGGNAAAKISTIRKIIGDGSMQGLAKTWVKQVADTAATDPKAALDMIDKIPADVREVFLGPQLDGELQNASSLYRQSIEHAEGQAATRTATHAETSESDQAAAKASANYQNVQNTAAHRQAMLDIKNRYNKAADAAETAYSGLKDTATTIRDTAVDVANSVKDIASQPFTRTFVRSLQDGDINKNLMSGNVSLNDIQAVRQAIGNPKWKDVSRGVFDRAIADAQGDPGKFMDWWNKIDPQVRADMFSLNDPMVGAQYRALVNDIKSAHNYTRIAKIGAGTAVAGTTAVAGGALGGMIGPVGELLGAVAGLSTAYPKVPFAKALIEYISLHPGMWDQLRTVGSTVAPVGPGIVNGARSLAKTAVLGTASQFVTPHTKQTVRTGQRVIFNGRPAVVTGQHPNGKVMIRWGK